MANAVLPLQLNKGLDLASPPLLAEPGALLGCLNYELTDSAGYRRIDGYERYDGYPDGDISEYYRLSLVAVTPAEQPLIIPASVIQRTGAITADVGVVLGGPFLNNGYDIASYGNLTNFSLLEEFLLLQDGSSFLLLQDGVGLVQLQSEGLGGGEFKVKTPTGQLIAVNLIGTPVSGKQLTAPTEYLATLRVYSSVLRSLVRRAPGIIAGLYWFEDRLLASIDAISIDVSVAPAAEQPVAGRLMRWQGMIYRAIYVELVNSGIANDYKAYLSPVRPSTTNNPSLVEVSSTDVSGTVWVADVSATGNVNTRSTKFASLGYFNNTNTSLSRSFVFLPQAFSFSYDAGSVLKPFVALSDTDYYYVVGDAGATVLKVRLSQVTQSSGSFTAGTAVGKAQVVVTSIISGTRDYLKDNDVIHNVYPTTTTSPRLTVNGTADISTLAGSASLDAADTKYVWDTYNFYGQSSTLSAYCTTGASKAFWANQYGFGTISTGLPLELDVPKYLAFHSNSLSLGFSKGSVLLSVAGEPYNYSGVDGAMEVATGDNVTGLLELAGDTLAVFGKRSIRKITGTTDADTRLTTISAGSSCFDYTAVLVGQEAIYTGVHGITTLQQSAAYGDFVGVRVSDPISTWLRPKLSKTLGTTGGGGVSFACAVRSKQQYRLVLLTGEVVSVTFTDKGPKLTFSNYGLGGQLRIPYCWSSSVGNDGQEKLHVSWDSYDLRDLVVSLDKGWGFDGQYFNHYFDVVHMFGESGASFMGVEKVRMYGQGYGVATLNIKSAGIEDDFDQEYHTTIQDISMPATPTVLYDRMKPVMSIVDQSNWGLGIKLRISNTTAEGSPSTEPSHICQVLTLHLRTEGAPDN